MTDKEKQKLIDHVKKQKEVLDRAKKLAKKKS